MYYMKICIVSHDVFHYNKKAALNCSFIKVASVVLLRKKRVSVVFVYRPIWFWILKHNLLLDLWKDRISKLTCHPFSVLSSTRKQNICLCRYTYTKIKITHIFVLSQYGFYPFKNDTIKLCYVLYSNNLLIINNSFSFLF